MQGRLAALGRRLAAAPPLVALGVLLLAAGIALTVAGVGAVGTGEGGGTVGTRIAGAIQLVQEILLWGDERIVESQPRFNSIFVAVFLDELTPDQQRTLGRGLALARGLVLDLTSPLGLLTLAAIAGGWFVVSRAARSGAIGEEPVHRLPFEERP